MKSLSIVFCILFLSSCSMLGIKEDPNYDRDYIKGGKLYKTEGWVDDNTFRVTAMGFPKKGVTNKMRRRYYSREGAVLTAQKMIIEKFKGARIKGGSASQGGETSTVVIRKEFGGIVSGGIVVHEKYDESDNCQVVYEVTSPGLKKRVMFGIQ